MADATGSTAKTSPPGQDDFTVHAYGPAARGVAVALRLVALLNVLYIAAFIVRDIVTGSRGAPPLAVAMGLASFSGVPFLLALLIGNAGKGRISIEPDKLVLTLRRERFEVPTASILAIRPLRLPLPGPGIRLVLTSNRSFERRLVLPDPAALLSAFDEALPSSRSALDHPAIRFATARRTHGRRRWPYFAVKYGLIPLVFAIVLFRLHQYIMYGGPFGQYHILGLGSYLRAFLMRWTGVAGGLIVYAGLVRFAVEVLSLGGTYLFAAHARGIRRAAEVVADIAYFVLIPAYVLALVLS
jgi:apolipoprotein N-acyltransferase